MKTLIFLIALVALSSAVNLRNQKKLDQNLDSVIQSLTNSERNALLEQFPMLVQMTGPLDSLEEFLSKLMKSLQDAQRQANTIFSAEHRKCQKEQRKRFANVEKAQKALKFERSKNFACKMSANLYRKSLKRAYNMKRLAVLQKATYEQEQKTLTERFSASNAGHEGFLRTLEKARKLVLEMAAQGGVTYEAHASSATALLQLRTNLQMTFKHTALSIVKWARKQQMLKTTAPLIKKMAVFIRTASRLHSHQDKLSDMGRTGVNKSMFDEMLALLDSLKKSTIEKKNAGAVAFNKNMAEISGKLENTVGTIKSYDAKIVRLSGFLAAKTACVARTDDYIAKLDGATGQIKKQLRILGKAANMCNAFQLTYNSQQHSRNEQVKLIRALKRAIEAKLSGVYNTAEIRARQENYEFDALNVESDYEFKDHWVM